MRLISNRGNLTGIEENENQPDYIDRALALGFDVNVDLWLKDNNLYLGTYKPEFKMDLDWFEKHHQKLWLHCHDLELLARFYDLDMMGTRLNYYYNEKELLTKTSKGYYILTSEKPFKGCIFQFPENHEYDYSLCFGLLSNNINRFNQK